MRVAKCILVTFHQYNRHYSLHMKTAIITQPRINKLVNTFCSDLEIKLVFTPFKIKSWFGAKDPIPTGLRSRVIYNFACTGYSACYIGETNHYEPTEDAHQGCSNSNMKAAE